MRVVVVTGGTQVDWDDMRTLTNRSKGTLGCQIANAYFDNGCDVTVIHAESVQTKDWLRKNIFDRRSFRTYDDLFEILFDLKNDPFDIIVMAAAISDYGFDKVKGKISSDNQTMTVSLKKLPKILSKMRDWYKEFRPFIIGFKLLSGVTKFELKDAAIHQMTVCRLNMTVANDWKEIGKFGGYFHPCYFATPEGGFIKKDGSKEVIAKEIAEFSMLRANVKWSKSISIQQDSERLCSKLVQESKASMISLLNLAQTFGLLHDISGNITFRVEGSNHFWATPRQVDKKSVIEKDLIYVIPDITAYATYYIGDVKPSIDCAVHARLYEALPALKSILHFHGGYVIPNKITDKQYPCGTIEEAEEILKTVRQRKEEESSIMIELRDHGFILLQFNEINDLLWKDLESLMIELRQHWADVGECARLIDSSVTPIFVGSKPIGFVCKSNDWHSVYLKDIYRGKGYGKIIGTMLTDKKLIIAVHDNCEAIDFYKKLGYIEIERRTPLTIMEFNNGIK